MRTPTRLLTASVATILCLGATLQAQTIFLERADRPPSTGKNHFLTATQPFSINIRVEGLTTIKGIFFEMQWTNAGAVRFDGWSADGAYAESEIVVPPVRTNQANGTGSISVAAQLSNPVNNPGLGDHTVIRLNFIGAANAVHNSRVRFSFVKPEAVVGNLDRSIERLIGISQSLDVHGFIDVWPGDANNDRIVDHSDWSAISQFFDDGDPAGRIRGFARDPASTIWAAQRSLSWDSVRVTYADADGSGRVDNTDFLVVMANFDRVHTGTVHSGGGKPHASKDAGDEHDPEVLRTLTNKNARDVISAAYSIPVIVKSDQNGLGLAGRISWDKLPADAKVVGIVNGELFAQPGGRFVDEIDNEGRSVNLAIGYFYPHPAVALNGTVAYVQVESESALPDNLELELKDAQGITRSRGLFRLEEVVSSVETPVAGSQLLSLAPNPAGASVKVQVDAALGSISAIEIFNLRGEQEFEIHVTPAAVQTLDVSSLQPGAYLLRIQTQGGRTVSANLHIQP